MDKLEGYYFSALFSGCFLLSSVLFSKVTREQRDPYMDEIFHIPQAQQYCQGHFHQWDPMITTLPGLYLTSVGIVKPAAWLFGWSGSVVCSSGMLRFINLLFSLGNLYMFYLILCRIHTKMNPGWRSRHVGLDQMEKTGKVNDSTRNVICFIPVAFFLLVLFSDVLQSSYWMLCYGILQYTLCWTFRKPLVMMWILFP
ncbi:dol-P-Glc:Glc(2)Man(9)GlcNAc(2)-PP-Dol alpha-1,2-glucosyltransferase isoform X2 [Dendrobates tinctorius]|uniref:dol-P-Glc:Glc(2)Man(9)GlcNAc(2)-PP-Dol alpha-1,2-glucosyltransferase isoform X2 n=1 Tax=Dendrobates tinctorius TaxID=92724 RepID=UPI003CCA5E4C